MEHVVEAKVIDSLHLKLKKPIPIEPGSTVMITIEATEGIPGGIATPEYHRQYRINLT